MIKEFENPFYKNYNSNIYNLNNCIYEDEHFIQFKNMFEEKVKDLEYNIEKVIMFQNLPLVIDNVYLSKSKISGNGIFAKRNLKKGQIITTYPNHIVIEKIPNTTNEIICFPEKIINLYGIQNNSFDMNKFSSALEKYKMKLTDTIVCAAIPEVIDDTAYIGHIINDGINTSEYNSEKWSQISFNTYYNINSITDQNAKFVNFNYYSKFIIALRDININEEIKVAYGVNYWKNILDGKNNVPIFTPL